MLLLQRIDFGRDYLIKSKDPDWLGTKGHCFWLSVLKSKRGSFSFLAVYVLFLLFIHFFIIYYSFIYLFIYVCIDGFVSLFILFIYVIYFVHWCMYLFIHLFIYIIIHLSNHTTVCKSVFLFQYLLILELHSQREIDSWAHHHFDSWAHELVDARFLK